MRQAIRIQPYLSRELVDKVRAYAGARSETVSGVVATALGEYLGRDEPDQDRVARRLDRLSQSVEQLGRDLDALGVGFSRFVRYSLWTLPERIDDKAIQRGEGLFRTFLSKVAEQTRARRTFTELVFPTRRSASVQPTPTSGGRDEGGRS